MNNYKEILKTCFYGLISPTCPTELIKLADRDFNNIHQNEAYELLWYLLISCGINLSKSCTFLRPIGLVDLSSNTKQIIEKFKGEILQALKELSKKSSWKIILRKSDMIAPNNLNFFKCSIYLGNVALNYQLQMFGVKFPPDIHLFKISESEFHTIFEELNVLNKKLKENLSVVKKSLTRYNLEVEMIQKDICELQVYKMEAISLIEENLKKAPKELIGKADLVKSWSEKADAITLKCNAKLQELKMLKRNVTFLYDYINAKRGKNVLEVNDASKLLSHETLQFSAENNIEAAPNGQISLVALLKILLISLPRSSINFESFKNLCETQGRVNNVAIKSELLSEKFMATKEKITLIFNKTRLSLDCKTNPDVVNNWMKDFFVEFPQVSFALSNTNTAKPRMDPFIDIDELELLNTL